MKQFFEYVTKHPKAVKKFFAALGAFVVSVAAFAVDGFTAVEVGALVVEAGGVLGVYGLSNEDTQTKTGSLINE